MLFAIITTIWLIVACIWVNAMVYIPDQRQIPRHSSMYIAMTKMIDQPSMVPIEG